MRTFLLLVLTALLFSATPLWAEFAPCQQLLGGRNKIDDFLCPPTLGDMRMDLKGNLVCGPGQCATNSMGKVMCSAHPGGLSVIDSYGKIKCVGGCVEASERYCVVPKY